MTCEHGDFNIREAVPTSDGLAHIEMLYSEEDKFFLARVAELEDDNRFGAFPGSVPLCRGKQ